jgi:hypothetical protein
MGYLFGPVVTLTPEVRSLLFELEPLARNGKFG